MIGKTLGHYEVTGELGKGGMGEVYRARDTKLGREVAIKVLPSEFAQDSERVARLEREARMLAALNHPNIAAIYGLEQQDDTRFLVLELVEGDTLGDLIRSGPVPVADSLKLALQIADALEAAHEKGVIHRDLKPANIKITPDGKVKVLDFGLAKAFAADERDVSVSNSPTLSMQATQQGVILGTAAYMSPEQTRGREVDKRTDIWAFGCVLYEMLTGRAAFQGEDVTEILASVIKSRADFALLPQNLHPALAKTLERCLEKDLKKRFRDIGDVQFELSQVMAEPTVEPVAAVVESKPQPRLPWVAAVVLAAIVAGGVVWALRPAPEPGPIVRFPFVLPEGQGFSRPEFSTVAVSPDGTRMAYVADGQIHVKDFSETESRPVDGTDEGGNGVSQPVFSPDGEWLAYTHVLAAGDFALRRVPVAGGTPVTVFEDGSQWGLSWPTSDTMLFAHGSGIVRIPANGGAPEVLVPAADDEHFDSPQILPGGDAVLFSRASGQARAGTLGALAENAQVVIQSIGGDDRTVVLDGGGGARYLTTGHLVYAQGSTLFAIPFDPNTRAVTGGPVPIVEGARRSSTGAGDTANYSVSDTGTLVMIPGTATSTPDTLLVTVDRTGAVSALDVPHAIYRSPRISPDGEQLAVEVIDSAGEGHIWIYDLSGGSAIRRLTQTGNNTRPIWTRDGQRVTFGSERDGTWGIWERPVDGSTIAERLTTADEGRRHFPDSWSPDGETLAYTDAGLANVEWDVWAFSRSSGDTELFAGGANNQFSATFSPDGEWLAYTSLTPVFGIYVQPFPQTGVVHQITDGSEAAPVWTAAGNELFFRPGTTTGQRSQIMGMEVSTTGGITFSNPQVLPIEGAIMTNGYRDFDIAPDGESFVMVFPAEMDEPGAAPLNRIDVVLNWVEELKERVPVDY